MSKTILFFADGTWNGPDAIDEKTKQSQDTNVVKLFDHLAGDVTSTIRNSLGERVELEKIGLGQAGKPTNIAKYIHGVGDGSNHFASIVEGAFGLGVVSRIVRGYTFLSRHYQPGDQIIVIGFSRGSYTVRALAGLVAGLGLLDHSKYDPNNKELAYELGVGAWHYYNERSRGSRFSIAHLLGDAHQWWRQAIGAKNFTPDMVVPIEKMQAVAVFDTVGALGIPNIFTEDYHSDQFVFVDLALSDKVEFGIHALSLDERRKNFLPTFWDKRAKGGIVQRVFAGAHSDVGGGFDDNEIESGLSNIALHWMLGQLVSKCPNIQWKREELGKPNIRGCMHRPWIHLPWSGLDKVTRAFPDDGRFELDSSVLDRIAASPVPVEAEEIPLPYQPKNPKFFQPD